LEAHHHRGLPILHALHHPQVGAQFAAMLATELAPQQVDCTLDLLEQAETRAFAEEQVRRQHEIGLDALNEALGAQGADSALCALATRLLQRQS
jgi:geranylgeranyl pyrophosphate synthase